MTDGALVPVHPEAVAGQPDVLRWVMPAGALGFVGRPVAVPAPLADLYAHGVLARPLSVEPTAVLLRLAEGRSWRAEGARVRSGLQAALARPDEWVQPAGSSDDDVLRSAAEEVLAGDVGDYVRGHGGLIEIVEVADGRITISLKGACEGCPASGLTVQRRFETAVRRHCPQLREVVTQEPTPHRGRLLPLLPRH